MKLSKFKISALAVGCAVGAVAIGGGNEGASEFRDMPEFLKEVNITQEMKERSDAHKTRANRLDINQPVSAQNHVPNTHRAIVQQQPFQWEADLVGEHSYIIEFTDQPVALYDGRISGFNATNVRQGISRSSASARSFTNDTFKLDINSHDVIRYKGYLENQQQSMIQTIRASVGSAADVRSTYQYALNGVSMKLSQQQASRIAELHGVRSVQRSKTYQLNTDVGPQHIGADQIWIPNEMQLANKGEGIVVGIIDTGVNTDHPAFAATAADGYVHTNPRNQYYGDCATAEFASLCNDKLIGVRSYAVITDSYSDPAFQGMGPWDDVDPLRPENGEDYQGHGSHTASTVAGNELHNVSYRLPELSETGDGLESDLVFPRISGVAPRANIISYQACYPGDGTLGDEWNPTSQYQGCPGEALISSIEDAITDGVDVINFSIGGGESSPWVDSVELAFLAAREAGISASLSAGNSGYNSRDHVAPWTTSVAATTHGREISYSEKTLSAMTGGDTTPPADIIGTGYTDGFTGNLVLASAYGDELCNSPFAVDTFTSDQIVVCKRGDIARVQKAINVQAGGAGGFILYNADWQQDAPWGSNEPSDPYVIPGILLKSYDGSTLVNWLSSGTGHAGTINASSMSAEMTGPLDYVADFSSRGPSVTTPNSMFPNVGAPGVDVFAAYADDMPFTMFPMTTDYAAISGTSMAAPHVAGAMALLTQLHPNWSPAEIESALMTTANSVGTAVVPPYGSVGAARFDDFGSGVINVEAASRATLVMDETGDNYRSANPNNGGDVSSLNEAYLFNLGCEFQCSWMRTFKATEAGSWTIEMNEFIEEGAELLTLNASPSTFTLEAGEVQSVLFTANAQDISNIVNDISAQVFEGEVLIRPASETAPVQRLPMRVQYQGDGLPNDLSVDIHRTEGSNLTPSLNTRAVGDIQSHMVKGISNTYNLIPFLSGVGTPEDLQADIDRGAIVQTFFNVPPNTKRIVFELTREKDRKTYHDSAIDIGKDVNGDGVVQWSDEAICYSFSYTRDFCAIDNPEPGMYWALVGNYTLYDPNNPGEMINPLEMTTNLAVIPETEDESLVVTVNGSANGIDAYELDLAWNVPEAVEGDVYFAAVELGRNANNVGDVGTMGVRFEHKGDDVSIIASQDKAKEGDIIDFEIVAKENLMAEDREFTLTAEIPEGLTLSHDSVEIEGIYGEMATIEGNTITITGTQPTSAMTPREYIWTTSDNDPLCRMPYEDDDQKDNWWDMSYFMPPTIIEGGSWDTFFLEPWELGFDSFTHYGKEWTGTMGINPAGFFQVDDMFYMNFSHSDMKWVQFPDTMIAALWHGSASIIEPGTFDFERGEMNGVYVATTINNELVVQWTGMEINDWWTGATGKYNAQTIFKAAPDYNEGQYEVLFGYDRLDASLNGQGAIGTRGYHGFRNPWGPNEGWLYNTFAINNVTDRTDVGTLVCGDYSGPEQTAIRVKFKALVSNYAAGSNNAVTVTSNYDDAPELVATAEVAVNGNIQLGSFNDATIDENTSLEGLVVDFASKTTTEKVISVTGENISFEASGHTSGSTVTITPDAFWNGTTEVTITVADAENENDKDSSSFMLTVMSDGIVAGCTDSAATNYNPEAGQDDSSCTFPAPEQPEPPKKKKGGSMWFTLLLLPLLLRRKQK